MSGFWFRAAGMRKRELCSLPAGHAGVAHEHHFPDLDSQGLATKERRPSLHVFGEIRQVTTGVSAQMTESTKPPLKPSERIHQLRFALGSTEAIIAYLDEHEASVHPIARAHAYQSVDWPAVGGCAHALILPTGECAKCGVSKSEPAHPAPTSPPSKDKPVGTVTFAEYERVCDMHIAKRDALKGMSVDLDEALAKLEASEARTEDYVRRLDTERNRVAFVESERDEALVKFAASEARCNECFDRLATSNSKASHYGAKYHAARREVRRLNAALRLGKLLAQKKAASHTGYCELVNHNLDIQESRANQYRDKLTEADTRLLALVHRSDEFEKLAAEAKRAQLTLAELYGMTHEPSMGPTWPANWDALLDRVRESEATVARLTAENSILRKAIVGTRAEVDEVKYLRLVDWETVARLRVELERAEEFVERLVSKGMWAMHTSVELTEGGIALVMVELDRQAVRLELLAKIRDTIVNGLVAIEEKYREDRKAEKA